MLAGAVLVAALIVTGRVQSWPEGRPVPTAAPSPAGGLQRGGVHLVPTPRGLRRQCREAAEFLGFPVPCPTLLPAFSPDAVARRFCDPEFLCAAGDGFVFEEREPMLPTDDAGADGRRPGRLAIAAAPRVAAYPVACLGGLKVGTVEVHERRGDLYECSPEAGAHFDGVLLRWREAGVVMAVSLYGHGEPNRRLVVVLAAHTEPVAP